MLVSIIAISFTYEPLTLQFLNFDFQIDDEEARIFITEVFAGCIRYSCVLKVMTDGFFARLGKTVLISERNLYTGIFSLLKVTTSISHHSNRYLIYKFR